MFLFDHDLFGKPLHHFSGSRSSESRLARLTRGEARRAVFAFIEGFYNPRRRIVVGGLGALDHRSHRIARRYAAGMRMMCRSPLAR